MADQQRPKPDRRAGKAKRRPAAPENDKDADQDPSSGEPQPERKVPGLNGYDPKLWPDVCR